ncbi:MAG: hypothetical protein RL342_1607, partial [Pseudomonadota bacterium]
INSAIDALIRNGFELPALDTLRRLAATVHSKVNAAQWSEVCDRLLFEQRVALETMLVVDPKTQKSPFANLRAAPGRASRRNLNALIDRYRWLQQLQNPTTALKSIADSKIFQWSNEARRLNGNTRRMAETAAHLSDHVFPRLPVRQWVLSVPKRLRYYMQRDGPVLNMVLRIFLRVIEQTLQAHCPGADHTDKANLHIGAVAFIHRFGSSLNEHVHFHVCAVDGVFEEVAGEGGDVDADAQARDQARGPGVIFHPATGVNATAVDQVQTTLRRRILRAFVGRGLLEGFEAKEMLGYKHSGFSVDTSVCIAAQDRAGLERLLRYCARPPFACERLRKAGRELVYRCAKQHSEPGSHPHNKRGAKADEITLTPLELIDRIAKLVPPPRTHRHRYYGVLAPNSPLRAAVVALAQGAAVQPAQAEPASTDAGEGALGAGNPLPTQAESAQLVPPKRPAHYLWAVLIARIYEVFPLLCPLCGGQMRIIAFITYSADIGQILEHIGAETEPPRITPARGPPLWDGADAQVGDGVDVAPDWDEAAQVAPDIDVDQRVSW